MTRWKLALMLFALLPCRAATWDSGLGSECADLNRAVLNKAAIGKLAEAEADLIAAMANAKSQLEPACEGLLLHNLAALTLMSGRFAQAETLAERSVYVLQPLLGPDAAGLLRPLHVLFSARLEQGKLGSARESFLMMQRIRLGKPEERALLHGAAAVLLQAEHRFAESELEFRSALADWQDAGKSNGGEAVSVLSGLASLYLAQEQLREAEGVLDRAFAALGDARDVMPVDRLKLLCLRGAVERRQGEWRKAGQDLGQAIDLSVLQPQPDAALAAHPMLLAAIMTEYAEVLRHQHRGREAKAMEQRAAALRGRSRVNEVVDVTELRQTSPPRKR